MADQALTPTPEAATEPIAVRLNERRAPWYVLLPGIVVAVAMLVPLGYLAVRGLEADPAALAGLVFRARTFTLLVNTVSLTAGVLIVTTAIALPLAVILERTTFPARRIVTVLAVFPLAVPGYVMAYSLISLGGNYGFLARVFGLSVARPSGFFGALAALSLYTFPYLFLNLRSALSGLDPGIEESAMSLGYSPREVFFRVVLPHLRPAFLSGWLVIGLYVLGDFGAVALMRFEVFSYAIFTQYSAAFDRVYAAWLSIILLSLTGAFVVIEARVLRNRRFSRLGSGVARRRRLSVMRPVPYAASGLFVVTVVGFSVGLPVVILSYWLTIAPPAVRAADLLGAFLRSAGASAPAALLAALLAVPIAYAGARYPSRLTRTFERAAYLGYAMPPLAFALALVFFSLRAAPILYQTLPLLIGAYALSFLVLALGPIRAALLQAPVRLEEAARSLGCTAFGAFTRTIVPLLGKGIRSGVILVFVISMKELPITFLLAPAGYTTLAVNVFSRTSEGMLAEAAPYAATIVLFSSLFVVLLLHKEGRVDEGKTITRRKNSSEGHRV